ncbi:MAG: hypothetical protein OXM02_07940 [Bacteroidota bacterium]|nr:hypothetical protein [Bacteroidota bacterium]MDE2834438.1 hypothetical protein [Bacteroidota bacterium]
MAATIRLDQIRLVLPLMRNWLLHPAIAELVYGYVVRMISLRETARRTDVGLRESPNYPYRKERLELFRGLFMHMADLVNMVSVPWGARRCGLMSADGG